MSLPAERQEAIRGTLGSIPDPQERLMVATSWKTTLDPLRDEDRIDSNLVRGCSSRVWLATAIEEGRFRFRVDGDSPLVRGLVRIICSIYDGATPEEVIAEEPTVLSDLGILQNLSPTRQNGLASLRRTIIDFATQVSRSAISVHNS